MENSYTYLTTEELAGRIKYDCRTIRQCLKDNLIFFTEGAIGEKNEFRINENGLSCGEVGSSSYLGIINRFGIKSLFYAIGQSKLYHTFVF